MVCLFLTPFLFNFSQFGKFGVISRSTVRQKDTGECKGYGFVEFESHEAAKAAIDQTNNILEIVPGRRLEVMRAQRKAERQEVLRYTARVTKKSVRFRLFRHFSFGCRREKIFTSRIWTTP